MPWRQWVVDRGTDELVGPCGCRISSGPDCLRQASDHECEKESTMGEAAEPRQQHETREPFLLVIDAEADIDMDHPIPVVLEAVKQALAPVKGITLVTAHVSIREAREEVLHAIDALADEEARRG